MKSYIPLPKELHYPKDGLVNIKNVDNKCFLHCHLYHIHIKEIMKIDLQHVSKYKNCINSIIPTLNSLEKIERYT